MTSRTMRAVVLDKPGPPSALQIRDVPVPKPETGQVLIRVKAFGLNRSEYHTRKGLATGVSFPRVLGIEATGVVEEAPGGEYQRGQKICAIMGGMGRVIDGGYADYCCVPVATCHPFRSDLPWSMLGAIPEMLQTCAGSLDALTLNAGDSLLIRGGTSSIGMFTAALAKSRGLTVFATSRSASRSQQLTQNGVDHVVIDDGHVAAGVRKISPEGVHGALELVGADTLKDTLQAVRPLGTVCFTGMLSDSWTVKDFYPIDFIPKGVRLTSYGGGSEDLSDQTLQDFIDAVAAKTATVPIFRVFDRMEDIVEAHEIMENNKAQGKLVVVL